MNNAYKTVEEYIETFPKDVQTSLVHVRTIINTIAPDAVESISYDIPTYKINGKPLVYFAAFKNHIGFYALPTGHLEFKDELSHYKQGKGSVQFPLDKPVPFKLIERIVAFRVKEIQSKTK
jgi:uncharacterized protein YdhG (YjbR/CyaY superfamily)